MLVGAFLVKVEHLKNVNAITIEIVEWVNWAELESSRLVCKLTNRFAVWQWTNVDMSCS